MRETMEAARFGDLYEVGGSEPVREAPPAKSSAFVGRDEELAALKGGLELAVAGRASLFLITGQAGMGKSRLVDELAGAAGSRDVRVLFGRCWEAVDAPAYWLWIQVLRQLCSELDDATLRSTTGGAAEIAHLVPQVAERLGITSAPDAATPDSRFGLFDAVSSFIQNSAESQPTMLVLEDLHAADESSLLLLQFLARQNRPSHLFIVGTYDDI